MTEDLLGRLATVGRLIVALACVVVLVIAHRTVGWTNLAVMLAALAGLLLVLSSYNRRYR